MGRGRVVAGLVIAVFVRTGRLPANPRAGGCGRGAVRPAIGAAVMPLVLAVGVVVLAFRRLLSTWRLGATAGIALLTALAAAASHLPDVGMFPGALYAALAIGALLVIGLGSVICIAFLKTPMPRRGYR